MICPSTDVNDRRKGDRAVRGRLVHVPVIRVVVESSRMSYTVAGELVTRDITT